MKIPTIYQVEIDRLNRIAVRHNNFFIEPEDYKYESAHYEELIKLATHYKVGIDSLKEVVKIAYPYPHEMWLEVSKKIEGLGPGVKSEI